MAPANLCVRLLIAGRSNQGHVPTPRQTISNDAPILLGKACELFVAELSSHAWVHAQSDKRVTLQVCEEIGPTHCEGK